jgi:hypothetical protein
MRSSPSSHDQECDDEGEHGATDNQEGKDKFHYEASFILLVR